MVKCARILATARGTRAYRRKEMGLCSFMIAQLSGWQTDKKELDNFKVSIRRRFQDASLSLWEHQQHEKMEGINSNIDAG